MPKAARMLIEAGADANLATADNHSPLLVAAREDNPELCTMLIDAKADVNRRSDDGWTPLDASTRNGNKEVVGKLIGAKADLELRGLYDMTPIVMATRKAGDNNDGREIVRMLIEAKVDVNYQKGNCSALQLVALGVGPRDLVEMLVQAKVDVNLSCDTADGSTPLHTAANAKSDNQVDVMKALVQAKADLKAKTKDNNYTPLKVAKEADRIDAMHYLESLGCKLDDEREEKGGRRG